MRCSAGLQCVLQQLAVPLQCKCLAAWVADVHVSAPAAQVKDEGFEIVHDNSLITIFSAPNYCDQVRLSELCSRYGQMSKQPMLQQSSRVFDPERLLSCMCNAAADGQQGGVHHVQGRGHDAAVHNVLAEPSPRCTADAVCGRPHESAHGHVVAGVV